MSITHQEDVVYLLVAVTHVGPFGIIITINCENILRDGEMENMSRYLVTYCRQYFIRSMWMVLTGVIGVGCVWTEKDKL